MNTAKALAAVLKSRGWTQADLARAAGWSVQYVSQLATGKRSAGRATQRKIADAAGVPVALLALLGADAADLAPHFTLDQADQLAATLLRMIEAKRRADCD